MDKTNFLLTGEEFRYLYLLQIYLSIRKARFLGWF